MTIAGVTCAISSSTTTQIICLTGSYSQSSISSLVQVNIQGLGVASNVSKSKFCLNENEKFYLLKF